MLRALASLLAVPLLVGAGTLPSTPDLGIAEGRCRTNESGPAFLVRAVGLKDRQGQLKLEVYPANDDDFLADDNLLVAAGKTFRRVVVDTIPNRRTVEICVRVPRAGRYAVTLLHDRDENRRFGWRVDGVGFAGNPRLGFSQPHASDASATAGSSPTRIDIVLNYRRGLAMRPIPQKD